jgi:two-component system, NtrC family, sensor kinase
VGATLIVLLGTTLVLAVDLLEDGLLREMTSSGQRLSGTIKRGLRHSMLKGDREAITRTVQAISEQEDIAGVDIYNKDGKTMFSSRPGRLHLAVDLTDAACRGCHLAGPAPAALDPARRASVFRDERRERVLEIVEPIENEPDCASSACHVHPAGRKILGVMAVSLSLSRVDLETSRVRRTATLAGAGAILLIASAVFLLVRRLVTRKIAALVEGTRLVSSGELGHRIPDLGRDELGALAVSFNEMTSALRDARGRLLRSEQLASLGRLAAGISHEINNPLTGILLLTSSMLERLDPADPRAGDLRTVVSETKRCREIVKGLLDFARQGEHRRTSVEVRELFDRALGVVRPRCERQGIGLTVPDAGAASPRVLVDPDQMQQVLLNLLLNALEALPDGGKITLGWREAEKAGEGGGGFVELRVEDTGPGIPSEDLAHVFEPFYTTKEKGTGLGLAICWGIVEQHGGTVSIESRAGRGTAVTIRLPHGA